MQTVYFYLYCTITVYTELYKKYSVEILTRIIFIDLKNTTINSICGINTWLEQLVGIYDTLAPTSRVTTRGSSVRALPGDPPTTRLLERKLSAMISPSIDSAILTCYTRAYHSNQENCMHLLLRSEIERNPGAYPKACSKNLFYRSLGRALNLGMVMDGPSKA